MARFLVRALKILTAAAACVAIFIAVMVLAPCEFHNRQLVQEAEGVVSSIEAYKARAGTLPNELPVTFPATSIPELVAEYLVAQDGNYTLRYSGLDHGFDGAWIEYSSLSGKMTCHNR